MAFEPVARTAYGNIIHPSELHKYSQARDGTWNLNITSSFYGNPVIDDKISLAEYGVGGSLNLNERALTSPKLIRDLTQAEYDIERAERVRAGLAADAAHKSGLDKFMMTALPTAIGAATLYGGGLAAQAALGGGAGAAGAGGGIGSGLSTAGATTTGAGAATGGGLTGLAAAPALTNVGIGSGAGMGTGGVPATFSTGAAAAGGIPATFSTGAAQMAAAAAAAPAAATGAGLAGLGAAPIGLQNFASDFLAPMEGASNVAGTSAYQALNAAGGVPASIGGNVAGFSQEPGRMLTDSGGIGEGLSPAGATTTGAGTATQAAGAAGTATGLLGDYEWLAPLLGLVSPGGGGGAGDSTMGPVGGGGGGGLGTDYTKGLESSLSALDFFRKKQLDADTQRLKTSMLQRGIMGSGIERDALTKLMSESAGQTEAAAQGAAIDWARLSQANVAQQYDWSQKVGLTREGVANQASQANQDARAKAWQLILSTPGLANKIKGFFS